MTNTTYISVQDLDYDDYPQGSDRKIGPFADDAAADRWMEDSEHFRRVQIAKGYFEWKYVRAFGKHSVCIKDLLDTYMTKPEDFR
jgi:hypothetical protein